MSIKGKLKLQYDGGAIPFHNPPIKPAHLVFTSASALLIKYISDPDVVSSIIPEIFEINEKPVILAGFYNWGMSRNGGYREVMLFVNVTFQGKAYIYPVFLYVTNETALIAGREPLGVPKLLGHIEFSPLKETNSPLVSAKLERPTGVPLAYSVIRPVRYYGKCEENSKVMEQPPIIGVRSFPGEPPITDVVAAQLEFTSGDIWECDGSISYTGFSQIDDVHKLPVIEHLNTFMITNASAKFVNGSLERFQIQKGIQGV